MKQAEEMEEDNSIYNDYNKWEYGKEYGESYIEKVKDDVQNHSKLANYQQDHFSEEPGDNCLTSGQGSYKMIQQIMISHYATQGGPVILEFAVWCASLPRDPCYSVISPQSIMTDP